MSATILVVEDEAIIAQDIKKTLEGLGYLVPRAAASSQEALDAVAAHRPDLVLMDIRIQGEMDGIATAALIGKTHGTPVVYLTSYSDDHTLERAKETGAYGYVLKPFHDRDLRTAIEVALEKRNLELRLSERERWLATTLKSIGDAVIATDVQRRIMFMNAVAERVTGWTSEDAAGRPLGEVMRLLDPKTGAAMDSPIEHPLRDAVLAPKREGERRSITASAAPIVDNVGRALGGVVVFRDVTEQRQLRDRLAQSERLAAIGMLSAGMAHELNNPLTYVLANVAIAVEEIRDLKELLRACEGAEAEALASRIESIANALTDAREGSERVSRIVHDIKKFGRLEKAETAVLELTAVLEGAIRTTENVLRHQTHVRREYAATPLVEAAESQLGQVFINFLLNAAQALEEGPVEKKEIVVAARTDEAGRAVAEVRDTGPGIPDEALRRIFDPFFTTRPVGQGSGLGLSIAHSIVEALGGTISVESRVGEGTTFRVVLPPAKQAVPNKVPPARDPSGRRGRVLIIDDEAAIGRAMGRALEKQHDVVVLTNARDALLRIAAGERFDVVFCDLTMPIMTGMDFFDALRESAPELVRRVVFVTGGAFTVRTERFLATTTNATVAKPVDPSELRRIVTDYVAGAPGPQGDGRP